MTATCVRTVADVVARVIADRPDARLVLPAGATPIPLYAELVARSRRGGIDLSHAHVFQLDELVGVGRDDPRSFRRFLRTQLLDHVPRSADRDHLFDGGAESPDREITRHVAALDALGGADLVVLGLGPNGHVGYNEPGSAIDAPARVVALARDTRAGLARSFAGDAPSHGITLGLREIRAAREIVMLVTGRKKREPLRRLRRATPDPAFPASWLLDHPAFTIVADPDADGA